MTRKQIAISALVVVAGLCGAQGITWVDQELRVIYVEYTLVTTNLGHIHGEHIRYRASVIRAVEADSREDLVNAVNSATDYGDRPYRSLRYNLPVRGTSVRWSLLSMSLPKMTVHHNEIVSPEGLTSPQSSNFRAQLA